MASIFPTTISLAERRMTFTGQVHRLVFVGATPEPCFALADWAKTVESIGPQVMPLALI